MPLTRLRPRQASNAQTKSRPTGLRPSVVSMKWAQKRRRNIISEVKTKRILPWLGSRIAPVMFWIQPSVPSSTAPTMAWMMNSDEEQPVADGELGDAGDPCEQADRDHRGDDRGRFHAADQRGEGALEEEVEHEANDGTAEDADVLEHFTEFQALGGSFGFREFLAEEHDAVDQRWGADRARAGLSSPSCSVSPRTQPTTPPSTMPSGQLACRMLR